jgi:hypothetical protein
MAATMGFTGFDERCFIAPGAAPGGRGKLADVAQAHHVDALAVAGLVAHVRMQQGRDTLQREQQRDEELSGEDHGGWDGRAGV